MLLFILVIPLLIARIKKYDCKNLIKAYDLYPLIMIELVHLFFQINALFGNYSFVRYAVYIQYAFNISLLVPIIYRKLYSPAICGSVFVIIGSILNRAVIACNNGKMPVYPTLSNITGFYKNGILSQGVDNLHILMSSSTSLNFFGDYIDLGFSIMSIGDILIHSFLGIIVFYTIKTLNLNKAKLN
ncbi:DUF5317 family protein [Sedimentibacter sp. zth1]|uniref:DUF5317 family protein n=1 Tax=Sedimentibacter sp. zth1 TaxID=2816908 RepID=UPI001A9381F6|nr:DUF5317 family protein [Sedimentibacter sp. zth1]QSX07064.1 DUF5317 family protein [Sedimentibacter sp. zth1]